MTPGAHPRVLIVGNRGGTNIGHSFERAAIGMGIPVAVAEPRVSMQGPAWLRRARWHLCGRKPLRLEAFSRAVLEMCREFRPDVLLVSGITPPDDRCLKAVGKMGVARASFLTDDPWNPSHRAGWFFDALREYDFVFTPRQANAGDLRNATRASVQYLPFGYDADLFFPAPSRDGFTSDVMFAGGADADRVPYIDRLARRGWKIDLRGSLWERYPETRLLTRGQAGADELRAAVAAARVCLCLVRRANRDGHSMRTFEVPAMGGCAVMERTAEHAAIFGEDGKRVLYFDSIDEMVERIAWLLEHPEERDRLAEAAHRWITAGGHTYQDRLSAILQAVGKPCPAVSTPPGAKV